MRFNELLEGTRADVSIKIFGPDLKTNMDLAKDIKEIVSTVEGAGDVEEDLAGTSPVLKVEPQDQALNRYGANISDVLDTVAIALGGQEVGYIFEGDRKFPIVVRLAEADRTDIDTIRNLPVGIGSNVTTPLATLSKIEFAETYGSISREDSNRRSAVLINLRGRDTESFVNEAKKIVEEKIKVPQGYYLQWGRKFKKSSRSKATPPSINPSCADNCFTNDLCCFSQRWTNTFDFLLCSFRSRWWNCQLNT